MRRAILVVALSAAGLAAALVPSAVGARSGGRPDAATVDTRCADAGDLVAGEREAVGGTLSPHGAGVVYGVRLDKLEGDACKPQKDCRELQAQVARLADDRAGVLQVQSESALGDAEQSFLHKYCSS